MLQSIISSKIQKSKQNIETYLSNNNSSQSQPQPATQPSASQSVARPATQQSTSFHNQAGTTASSQPKNKILKNQLEFKMISAAGRQSNKDGVFRFNKDQGRLEFLFQEDGVKTKVQAKREVLVGGKRVKPNMLDGSILFEMKQAIVRKEDSKESALKGKSIWSNGKQVAEYNATIWVKEKDMLRQLVENPFMDGLIETLPNIYADQPKNTDVQAAEEAGDLEQDHGHVKLIPPTSAQQGQVQKIRKIIKQMKQQDKVTVLIEVFKIKKQYEDQTSTKKLKCPVHYCIYCQKKSYKDLQQLKNHLKTKHPELSKHGIQLSEFDGTFQYGSKAMDLALFIGKMYPTEMKKIIKQMKTKQPE